MIILTDEVLQCVKRSMCIRHPAHSLFLLFVFSCREEVSQEELEDGVRGLKRLLETTVLRVSNRAWPKS